MSLESKLWLDCVCTYIRSTCPFALCLIAAKFRRSAGPAASLAWDSAYASCNQYQSLSYVPDLAIDLWWGLTACGLTDFSKSVSIEQASTMRPSWRASFAPQRLAPMTVW